MAPAYPFYVAPNQYAPYLPHGSWPYAPAAWGLHPPLPALEGLNPVISAGPTVTSYDVRHYPRNVIPPQVYESMGTHPVKPHSPKPPSRIRVVSKRFVGFIEVNGFTAVTCKDVWKSLHFELQRPITEHDWMHIARDEPLKYVVRKAYEKRVKPEDRSSSPVRRIDYLGEATLFVGLEKDDSFVQNMVMPGTKDIQETWVAKFMRPALRGRP